MTAADRLAQIKARADAATEGPWAYGGKNRITTPVIDVDEADWGGEGLSGYAIHAQQDTGAWRYADAAFMAHARTDVPALVAALRAVLDLADYWATQSTDYDEDTEQQIDDGKAIVRAIEEALDA